VLGASAAQPSGTAAAPARALVGYARVSTRDQTTALQLDALRAAGCDRVFEETASGASRDRPELAAALDYVRAGDTLVVWKLDRLARSTKQLLTTVEELARRGIGFRCLTQDIDTTTAGGRLVFTVFSAIAEFEREIIAERTRAGLDAARARGRRGGRKPKLKARDLVRARAMLRDPEIPVAEVAETMGVGVATLYRHLPGGRGAAVQARAEPVPTGSAGENPPG
jgi:DNA invertase Pin-like site-specific DNA recombinase